MNRAEAQFILGAYRASGADAPDPQFQEALALARQDPELARWFAAEQALDQALAARIRSQPVPSDLRAQLLVARATARGNPRWRRPVWLGVAAGFGLLLVAAGGLYRQRAHAAEFGAFRGAMARAALDMSDHVDVMGLDAEGYKRWLGERRSPADFVLPAGLAAKGIAACKIVDWQQQRVTMLCIKFGGRHVDVFVVNESELPGVQLGSTPSFFADAGVTSAAWRREGKVYLLAGAMPKEDLQALL